MTLFACDMCQKRKSYNVIVGDYGQKASHRELCVLVRAFCARLGAYLCLETPLPSSAQHNGIIFLFVHLFARAAPCLPACLPACRGEKPRCHQRRRVLKSPNRNAVVMTKSLCYLVCLCLYVS